MKYSYLKIKNVFFKVHKQVERWRAGSCLKAFSKQSDRKQTMSPDTRSACGGSAAPVSTNAAHQHGSASHTLTRHTPNAKRPEAVHKLRGHLKNEKKEKENWPLGSKWSH